LAIVSLIALLVALAVAVLISLQPWGDDSTTVPQLNLAPEVGIGLDDAVEAPPGRQLAIAPAQPAGGGEGRLAGNELAVASGPAQARTDIAPAQVVTSDRQDVPGGPSRPPAPKPVPSQPAPAPEPVPVSAPVSAPAPEAAPPSRTPGYGTPPPGPIAGGVDPGEEAPRPSDSVEIHPGEELEYPFSFAVESTSFRSPGEDAPVLRIRSEESASASFGLQLWDDGAGQRGLWASGDAMGGQRFLAPLAEGVAHQATLYLRASSEADGFYLLTVDGQPVDARAWISLIDSGSSYALIETFIP
jgi:hypothetical protein